MPSCRDVDAGKLGVSVVCFVCSNVISPAVCLQVYGAGARGQLHEPGTAKQGGQGQPYGPRPSVAAG